MAQINPNAFSTKIFQRMQMNSMQSKWRFKMFANELNSKFRSVHFFFLFLVSHLVHYLSFSPLLSISLNFSLSLALPFSLVRLLSMFEFAISHTMN